MAAAAGRLSGDATTSYDGAMTLPLGRRRQASGIAAAALAALLAATPALAKTPANDDRAVASRYGSYLAARHAETISAIDDAAQFMEQVLAADPDNDRIIGHAFVLLVNDGRMDQAEKLAVRATPQSSWSPLANMVLALKSAKGGDFADADKRLAGLVPRGPYEVLLPLLRAWVQVGLKQPDQALKTLGALEAMDGFANFYNLHSALILDLAGRTKEAAARFDKATAGQEAPVLRLVQAKGAFLERTGNADAARKMYEDFLKQAPESLIIQEALTRIKERKKPRAFVASPTEGMAEALLDMAAALRQESGGRSAMIYARLAHYMRSDLGPALILIGNVLDSRAQFDDAIAAYRMIPKASPLAWSARLSIAQDENEIKRTDDAVKELESMAKERPERWDALIALGDILRGRERFAEAVKAYDRGLERIPRLEKRHWVLLYSRGIALERSKQWPRAEADFKKALEFEPDQPFVLNYLGYSWVERGEHLEEAQKMIERAVELRQDDGYITDSLGWVFFRTGQYEAAVKQLERAVELRPQDSTINDHLGDAYWKVGRYHEARFQWKRALSLKPEADQVPLIEAKLQHGLAEAGKPEKSNN
jgi:tetratricopeptide (TPR) repeat protein